MRSNLLLDLGLHKVRNFGPLDDDTTAAVKRGAPNVIVLAADNTAINELGTGGIVRPALIYTANE